MVAMVAVERLVKCFGPITAVNGISFDVERGEVLGFLGPNGAGKSTTMKMVAGFLSPDEGRVCIDGADSAQHQIASKQRIGYLPEGAPLYGDMSPRLFLRFVGEIRGIRADELQKCIDNAIGRINLESVIDQPIETLSKGFKRRVGIAQAILHDPEVLILDEPTDGLDPNQKREVRDLIRELSPQKAIILSTHILEEVDAVCTRAIIIAGGEIVVDGEPAELRARSPRYNAVVLDVRGRPAAEIEAALGGIDGVAEICSEATAGGSIRFVVRPENGQSIIDRVSTVVLENSWPVEELRVERGRLDEVFRSVTDVQRS